MLENLKSNGRFRLEMRQVEEIMIRQIESRHNNVHDLLKNMIHSGGKKLRPQFLILAAQFGNGESQEIYEAAAGLEMIHMATLIHDDIIDDAFLRRGQRTGQSRFGKDYAVFMGDFLLNRSYHLLSGKSYIGDVLLVMEKIFYGEMLQYNLRYTQHKSISNYIRIAANKTASLFAFSFYLGAKVSGCSEALCKALKRVGFYFGMSFQIMDDILDFTAREQTLGKDVQNDIKMGVYTLPIIYSARASESIWEAVQAHDFEALSSRIIDLDGLMQTRMLANRYLEKALKEADPLPDIEAKKMITDIIEQIHFTLEKSF